MDGQEVTTREYENLVLLANSVQLGVNVLRNIIGNEIADGFAGQEMSIAEMSNIMAAKLNAYLMNPTVGEKA